MTFDNSKTIINLRIKIFGATVLLLAYVVLTYVAKVIKFPLLGLGDTAWTVILVILYLIGAFLPMILNYQYVWFSDEDENIVLRYFTAGIVGGKKNTVEINKISFAGFQIETKYFGFSKTLILYQRSAQQTAKYPPIYISALSKEQYKKLISALKKYSSAV
jgi:hypothetical protein